MATGGNNPYLPPEIIMEILKRLRVKSLLRFRAVCKDWRNLFKSPSFIEEHLHHSTHKNPLLVCHVSIRNPIYSPLCLLRYEKETVKAERIPEMDSLRRVDHLIGSSNGLLCVKLGEEKYDTSPSLLLLNLATREIRQVPRSRNDYCRYCYFGFGYSPVVRDYKLVRIHPKFYNDDMHVDMAQVYSLRTGSWKEVESGVIQGARDLYNPVAVNGAIFWIGWEVEYNRRVIISFDLAMEVFALIPIPSSDSVLPLNRCVLDAYENKLAMIHEYLHVLKVPQYAFIDLWVLEEGSGAYGKSWGWTKKYSIRPNRPSLHPIWLWRNEIVCPNCSDPNFLFHLTANNELKKFHTSLSKGDMYGSLFYAESLVSMCDMYFE